MNALRKIDKILNRVRSVVLVALLVSMMGMCTMNVVLRYLIKGVSFLRPFSWVNEMMQMLAIWVVFLAAGLGVRQDAHVSLESFTEKYLPAKASRILHKAAQVIVIATLVLLIVIGIQQTIKSAQVSCRTCPSPMHGSMQRSRWDVRIFFTNIF